MDAECLNYCLTKKENQQFEQDCFFIVENALPSELVENLISAVYRLLLQHRHNNGLAEQDRVKGKTAATPEAVAVVQNTPLLTHDNCCMLSRIEKRARYLARRCRKDAIVPASVLQELEAYARGVGQITNAFLVVSGAMALPTRIARETWACAIDSVAIKAH